MNRPIRSSLIAATVLGALTLATGVTGVHGAIVELVRFLAVFFASSFLLLLAYSLFCNRSWRLAPPPRWATAYAASGGRQPW